MLWGGACMPSGRPLSLIGKQKHTQVGSSRISASVWEERQSGGWARMREAGEVFRLYISADTRRTVRAAEPLTPEAAFRASSPRMTRCMSLYVGVLSSESGVIWAQDATRQARALTQLFSSHPFHQPVYHQHLCLALSVLWTLLSVLVVQIG